MRFAAIAILCLAGLLSSTLCAGETGHYVNGVEGIRAATLPPPGFYYRFYNSFYSADKLTDKDGNKLDVDFDLNVYAMVQRFVWISETKILGGDFGASTVLPVINTDIEMGALGVDDSSFAFGDIAVEPFLLGWHEPSYDAAFSLSFYAPTGKYDKEEPASPGKDFWTGMITLGATGYLDENKSWSASILGRYEFHSQKGDTKVKPGNDFHFEWGVAKQFDKIFDVGLTGYCHWQVTDDRGSDVTWNNNVHDRVFAAGPEISIFIPSIMCSLCLRSQWEFGAVDRPEGNMTTLTLTCIF